MKHLHEFLRPLAYLDGNERFTAFWCALGDIAYRRRLHPGRIRHILQVL